MEQTAVEYIVDQLDCLYKDRKLNLIDAETFFKHKKAIIEYAKAIEKGQKGYSEEQVLEVFEHFKMHLPFHYEFLVKEHLQQLKPQEQ